MPRLRTMLLFDPNMQPQCWNERMAPGEFAVLYSFHQLEPSSQFDNQTNTTSGDPFCTIFSTFAEADHYATQQILLQPTLRCRIYDHHGLANQPILELCGKDHKKDSEISPRFRRWGGSLLFLSGVILIAVDWRSGFSLSWPAALGVRALPIGLILLLTELVIVFEARRKSARIHRAPQMPS